MGRITAKLHARADADVDHGLMRYHSEDEIAAAIGNDVEAFCDYAADWSMAYAHQVEADYACSRNGRRSGRRCMPRRSKAVRGEGGGMM